MDGILKAGTILHKRYEVVRILGEGDFGVVYHARDRRAANTPKHVAIKQMPMQMIVECERQADLRATLVHPSIPRVFDYFATAEHSYLVRELIRGSNLEEVLNHHPGFLPESRIVYWAIQLCGALDVLHHHPIHPMIFRDLKPNNIIVDRAERVHLVDFELARAFPPGYFQVTQADMKHYRKGFPIGTKGYSPPEQYRGVVAPQSDIYALGATMHHLLTRRDPRQAKPFTFQDQPVRSLNPSISMDLEAIVMKAVNRKIRHRFSTAQEMKSALEYSASVVGYRQKG